MFQAALKFAIPILLLALAKTPVRASAEANDRYGDCKKICKDHFQKELGTKLCQPALNLMPRPGVYKACINGRTLGFEQTCIPSCMGEEPQEPNSFKACKSEEKKPRPNHQLPWCRQGYDMAYKETKEQISAKAEEFFDAKTSKEEEASGDTKEESESLHLTKEKYEEESVDRVNVRNEKRNAREPTTSKATATEDKTVQNAAKPTKTSDEKDLGDKKEERESMPRTPSQVESRPKEESVLQQDNTIHDAAKLSGATPARTHVRSEVGKSTEEF